MKTFGEEQGWRKCLFVEAQFRRAVSEGAILRAVVAVPAASGEAAGVITDEA